jgi:general secretion pathway protein G
VHKDTYLFKGYDMMNERGFTLVEILIVVVILGILAVIVVPMFSDAATQSCTSALCNDLRKIRSQIELYKFHHNDQLPAFTGETSADFNRRMTSMTDINGDAGTEFGSYLNSIPANPFNNLRTVRIDGAAGGANTEGWRFDTTSGTFQADDSAVHAAL